MRYLILIILIPLSLFCRQRTYDHIQEAYNPPYIPWFTGSILPPSAVNAAPGHPIIAPIFGVINTYGEYNNNWKFKRTDNTWAVNPFFEFLFGINDHIGVDIYCSFISNFKKGQSSTYLQDTIILLGFQIAKDTPKSWVPDIRFIIQETFPTGNYQKLSPKKLGTDSTGQGSFQTGFNLVAQKLFPLENQFLLLKWTLGYLFPAPVSVKGLNTYGGGHGTSGKIFPGQTLMMYFSGEYSLNQRWVFAFDLYMDCQGKSTFSGKRGFTSNGIENAIGTPRMIQISAAPQVEYNFSGTSGLLFGAWGTIFGKNSPAYINFMGAYYIAF